MVGQSREIKLALGSGQKKVTRGEWSKRHLSQRGIVTRKRIAKGQVFTHENLTTKRPGDGVPPVFLEKIIGHRAANEIAEDTVIKWEDVFA